MPRTASGPTVVHPVSMDDDAFETWLYGECEGIGGNDVARILGLDQYGGPAQVWDRIFGMERQEDSTAMQRGRALEPIVADIYARETGRHVVTCPMTMWQGGDDIGRLTLRARVDRVWVTIPGAPPAGVIEIKVLGQRTFQETKRQGLDPKYYLQGQLYAFVLRVPTVSFAVFNAEDWELHWFDVPFDEALWTHTIQPKLWEFWRFHVITRQRPTSATSPDVQFVRRLPMVGRAYEPVEGEPELESAVAILRSRRIMRDSAISSYDEQVERVKTLLGDRQRVQVAGVRISYAEGTLRMLSHQRIARFLAEHGRQIDEFYDVRVSRSFRPTFSGEG